MSYDLAFGDLSRREEMRGNFVKGNLVLSRRWYLAERAPPGSINRVLAVLSPSARDLLERPVMPFGWLDFGLLMDVDAAIVSEVMKGHVESMRDFGHALGVRDFGTVYRAFMSLASPEFVLRKVSALGSMYFRESTLAYEPVSPGKGKILLIGRTMPRYMCQYGISGWEMAVLEAAKAASPRVEHTRCVHQNAERCEWSCSWAQSEPKPKLASR